MKKQVKFLKEAIVSFATAKLAKEKGFWYDGRTNDWLSTTLPYHDNGTRPIDLSYKGELWSAPTQVLLQKWLREKWNIFVEVNYRKFAVKGVNGYYYMCGSKKYHTINSYFGKNVFQPFDTYEDALEVGLQQGLNLIIIDKKANVHPVKEVPKLDNDYTDTHTVTSEAIIGYLVGAGYALDAVDKSYLRKTIGDSLQSAAEWQSNGCDCGQVACPICGG